MSRDYPPPRLPAGVAVVVGDTDPDDELRDPDAPEILDAIGATYLLHYRDSKGIETKRRITLQRVYTMGHIFYLGARCHERAAYRCFKASSAVNLVNLRTGEIVEDAVSWCNRILRNGSAEELLRNARYDVAVLLAFGRSDGWLDDEERAIITDHVLDCANYPPDIDPADVEDLIDDLYPNKSNVQRAMAQLRRHPDEHKRRLLRTVSKLVDLDGEVSIVEMDLLMELTGWLDKLAAKRS